MAIPNPDGKLEEALSSVNEMYAGEAGIGYQMSDITKALLSLTLLEDAA